MQVDRKKFGQTVLQTIYDLEEIGVNPKEALSGILAEIDELIDLNVPETMNSRHDYFRIPNTTAEDYKERFFEIQPDRHALVGIRHLSGAKDQPFVHLLLGFTPTAQDLPTIKEFSLKHFRAFSPRQISLWLRPSSALALELEKKGFAARRYVAGKLSKISKRPLPLGYERVTFEKMKSAPEGSWYVRAYSDFHAECPELERWVPIAEKEELQRCADEELLFRVLVDGHHAGLIGGRNESLLGSSAVYMTELLLMRPFKGQGLAAALQRKFLDSLGPEFNLVWGTIDAKNEASHRTALKIGRIAIRSEFFLPLGGD